MDLILPFLILRDIHRTHTSPHSHTTLSLRYTHYLSLTQVHTQPPLSLRYTHNPLSHSGIHTTPSLTQVHTQPSLSLRYTHNPLSHSGIHTTPSLTQVHTQPPPSLSYTHNPLSHSGIRTTLSLIQVYTLPFLSLRYTHNRLSHSGTHTLPLSRSGTHTTLFLKYTHYLSQSRTLVLARGEKDSQLFLMAHTQQTCTHTLPFSSTTTLPLPPPFPHTYSNYPQSPSPPFPVNMQNWNLFSLDVFYWYLNNNVSVVRGERPCDTVVIITQIHKVNAVYMRTIQFF